MACGKCGAKRSGSKYPVMVGYSTSSSDESVETALVQFRSGIHVIIDDIPTNFYPGQIINLSYDLISVLVEQDSDILYFHSAEERQRFLMLLPEHEGATL